MTYHAQRAHIHVAFTLLLFQYSQYVQVQVGNEKENDVVRLVYSIEDNKIVKARQVVDDCLFSVAKARFTNRRFRLRAHLKDISS